MRLLIAVLTVEFLVGSSLCFGENITTLKGKTYTGVTVQYVEPDGIMIKHSAGLGKVFFSELSPELRDKYGYDPEKHRQQNILQQKKAEITRALKDAEAKSIQVEARLSQVFSEGALAYIKTYQTRTYTETYTESHAGSATHSTLSGGTRTMRSGSQGAVVKSRVRTDTIEGEEQDDPVFIIGIPRNYSDRSTWRGQLCLLGTYTYTTVLGVEMTVDKYITLNSLARIIVASSSTSETTSKASAPAAGNSDEWGFGSP